ncbi:hypothetical protein PQU95_05760 [Vogesella sp. DC21W]|uniref:Uncharacterized protein n=1 Tax=Vogesella aquatica TaxID=2984206 RepID=A0ABT5IWQ0_9NEIS|nr:hypothetical protein [Vogesella aquatica]MDC7716720.1 hypothetical protein [Vogesella aquatica]
MSCNLNVMSKILLVLMQALPEITLLLAASAVGALWLIGIGALLAIVPFFVLLAWAWTKRPS